MGNNTTKDIGNLQQMQMATEKLQLLMNGVLSL
jgi:hypothetical protein